MCLFQAHAFVIRFPSPFHSTSPPGVDSVTANVSLTRRGLPSIEIHSHHKYAWPSCCPPNVGPWPVHPFWSGQISCGVQKVIHMYNIPCTLFLIPPHFCGFLEEPDPTPSMTLLIYDLSGVRNEECRHTEEERNQSALWLIPAPPAS